MEKWKEKLAETGAVIIRLKQPLYLRAPNGEWTSQDTGITMFPKGLNRFVDDKIRKQYDEAGIAYEVVAGADRCSREHANEFRCRLPQEGKNINHESMWSGWTSMHVFMDDEDCVYEYRSRPACISCGEPGCECHEHTDGTPSGMEPVEGDEYSSAVELAESNGAASVPVEGTNICAMQTVLGGVVVAQAVYNKGKKPRYEVRK